jgi:group I intron endonuclease
MQGVYFIKNIINDKIYVGSSIDIEERWKVHKRNLNRNNHCNKKLQRAWNKYGDENFKFIIVEESLIENLRLREKYWIDILNSIVKGYNISSETTHPQIPYTTERRIKMSNAAKIRKETGEYFTKEVRKKISDGLTGRKRSQESIDKWKKTMNGRSLSEEHKKNLSESLKGREITIETRKKLSDINKGKVLSQEQKNKISQSLTGRSKLNEEQIQKAKEMILQKMSMTVIARELKCSVGPVKTIRNKIKNDFL